MHSDADDPAAGWHVARRACEQAGAMLGDRLISVYAIGSLAHGGFAAAVSDVDVAVLVDRCDASVSAVAAAIVESTRQGLGSCLADRLSVFYGDWGSFGSPPPTAEFLRRWLTRRHGVDELIAAGPRVLTKNVFFPVRFLYIHATGRAGANQDAVDWFRELGSPHAPLAVAALRWRAGDIDPVAARRLLERHLDGLYAECCKVYGC